MSTKHGLKRHPNFLMHIHISLCCLLFQSYGGWLPGTLQTGFAWKWMYIHPLEYGKHLRVKHSFTSMDYTYRPPPLSHPPTPDLAQRLLVQRLSQFFVTFTMPPQQCHQCKGCGFPSYHLWHQYTRENGLVWEVCRSEHQNRPPA